MLVLGMAPEMVAQPLPRVVISGLNSPGRLLSLDSGVVLVTENGTGPNTGRVSAITADGRRATLIDGLPAGLAAPNNDPSGAAALAVRNRTLFIVIGTGDSVLRGPIPGTEIPNPRPSSPLLSSVLALDFDRGLDSSGGGFFFEVTSHTVVASGKSVVLTNPAGETATLRLVIDIPNNIPNPRPDFPENVRTSNPFGLEPADSCGLWLVDASRNLIWRVDICTNTYAAALTFPPYESPLPTGPRLLDAVPTSARSFRGDLLVTFLTGNPFPAGLAEVRRVKPPSGESLVFLGGLHMLVDVLPYRASPDGFFVLEFSQAITTGAPGRVLWFDSVRSAPVVLSDQVIGPTHMAIDPRTGELLVCEFRTGRIVAIPVPR